MEKLFGRRAWTLRVGLTILIALTAGLGGRARARGRGGAVTAAELRRKGHGPLAPAVRSGDDDGRPRRTLRGVSVTVDGAALAAVFGVHAAQPDVPEASTPQGGPDIDGPSRLPATLVATVVTEPERYSLALITDHDLRETRAYGVGDVLRGEARLVRIDRRRVLLRNGERLELLEMGVPPGSDGAAGGARSRGEASSADRGVEQRGEHAYVIAEDTVEQTLADLSSIVGDARVVPAFESGVARGVKLFSIRPGSLFAKLGLQNGDVIRRVNGYDLGSPSRALELYEKLKSARRIEVELARRGRTVTKTYDIVP